MTYKIPYAGADVFRKRVYINALQKAGKQKEKKVDVNSVDIKCSFLPTKVDNRPLNIPGCPNSLRKILLDVCAEFIAHPNDVVGLSREVAMVKVRQEFIWRCKNEGNASFTRIGKILNRDHSTMVYHYHCRKARQDIATLDDPKVMKIAQYSAKEKHTDILNYRQELVRNLIIDGYNNYEIAVKLNISTTAVKNDKRVIRKINPIPGE